MRLRLDAAPHVGLDRLRVLETLQQSAPGSIRRLAQQMVLEVLLLSGLLRQDQPALQQA